MSERYAIITTSTPDAVAAYMPANYMVMGRSADGAVLISGVDNCGWTLEDYVLPRLASGLYWGREIGHDEFLTELGADVECDVCSCCDEIGPGAPGAGGAPWICNECATPADPYAHQESASAAAWRKSWSTRR